MAGLIFLYLGVFVILVTIQFTKQRGFTRYVGSMLVSGCYGESSVQAADAESGPPPGVYPLEGDVTVSFGGIEFRLHDGGEFVLLKSGGEKDSLLPQTMRVYDNSAAFGFRDGTQLVFNEANAPEAGGPGLRITGNFGEDYEGLELPYRILRTSRIQDTGGGQFVIVAEGISYSFGSSQLDGGRRALILDAKDVTANYRAVPAGAMPEDEKSGPGAFVLSAARDKALYARTVNRWRDEAYSLWSRAVRNTDDEALIIAYAGESVDRGSYQEAVAGISPAFLRRASWTYNASVYLGRLDTGLRSISAFERETAARLSALISAKSEKFFLESHAIEFCGLRGYGQLLDGAAGLARSVNTASLSPALIPGILEAYAEWNVYYSQRGNSGDNPFANLAESACPVIYEGLRRTSDGERALYFQDDRADMKYNLLLGLALDRYGQPSNDREDWGALGRSLVISVLSFTENGGLPAELIISGAEETGGNPGTRNIVNAVPARTRIDALTLYPFFPAATYPHAVGIGSPANGIWAWTASDSVTVTQENNVLDIAAAFPEGQTHYMLIRGLRPFVKLQLHGIDYRTDPQFERYNSSGWSFSSSEQTLLLKLKHRSRVEHIRVFY
jgi:hypothetical protein